MDAMLKIRVVSHGGRPPDTPLEVCLDGSGGTIGRLATNHLVLPDPERRVSRVHARIVHGPGGYFVLREGRNSILLNGVPLRAGAQAPLNDGDELTLSTYLLRISLMDRGVDRAPGRSIPRSALFFSWETDMGLERIEAAQSPRGGDSACGPGEGAATQGGDAAVPGEVRVPHPGPEARAMSSSEPLPPMPASSTIQSFLDAASTRKALEEALERFNPANLEHRLRQRFIFDSAVSIQRKARLWDVFGSVYAEIAREARDEIRSALLREFIRMNEEQAQRPTANERDPGESR